ncbi:MAG: PhoH family protein [Candidatus Schekmanbacteria bacterium]|nr:PhoH family protein [Candidatus Schekmanbacteria bacterium]
MSPQDFENALQYALRQDSCDSADFFRQMLFAPTMRHAVSPKSPRQAMFIRAMQQHDIVFAIGPAGTGKTYLAVAMAVVAFLEKKVRRIILARPAVEAGERLGFLPGDLIQKVNPYMRPLYDALYDLMDRDRVGVLLEKDEIEVAPVAFMRGRTLSEAFVILDEAQNTTPAQMKMLLTRLGQGSKAVITGDITQIDLPDPKNSGLVTIQRILNNVRGIEFVYLGDRDIVRHDLVQRIIRAYEKHGE